MRPRRPAVALAVLAGCSSPGALVAEHAPYDPLGIGHVTVAGTYGLFIAGQDQPLLRYPLVAGDPIGFDHVSGPATNTTLLQVDWLYGVAGTARGRLDARQTYQWRRLSEGR